MPAPLFAVQAALQRLQALLAAGLMDAKQEPAAWTAVHVLLADVARGREMGPTAHEALCRAAFVLCVSGLAAWAPDAAGGGGGGDTEAAEALVDRKEKTYAELAKVMQSPTAGAALKHQACMQLSNLMFMFAPSRWRGTPLAAAASEPSDALMRAMWFHCTDTLCNISGDVSPSAAEGAASLGNLLVQTKYFEVAMLWPAFR